MVPHPVITATDGFAWRLSAFYAAFFLYAGITLPFLPVWLESKGLDAREIGIVLASPLVVRLVVVPISTRLADRFALLRSTLVTISIVSVAGFAVVGLSDGFLMILLALSLASVFATPILPLADAYALRGLGERRRAYGPVRLWGSVSFIAANLAGGVLLELAGAGNLIWVLVAAQALTALTALFLVPQTPRVGPVTEAAQRRSLWRVPIFVAVVMSASLIQASHAVLQGFATLQWTARGLEGPAIGALWSTGVVVEIVLFAVSGRVVAAVGALPMIAVGGLAAVIRWSAMAIDPPSALLPVLQCLHALSYGATHLGTMAFLARFASVSRGATAQGDYVAVQGIVFAAAMGLSGVMVEASAALAYAAMAAAAAVGALIAIVARRHAPAADRP